MYLILAVIRQNDGNTSADVLLTRDAEKMKEFLSDYIPEMNKDYHIRMIRAEQDDGSIYEFCTDFPSGEEITVVTRQSAEIDGLLDYVIRSKTS